jgi:hypothetical protein
MSEPTIRQQLERWVVEEDAGNGTFRKVSLWSYVETLIAEARAAALDTHGRPLGDIDHDHYFCCAQYRLDIEAVAMDEGRADALREAAERVRALRRGDQLPGYQNTMEKWVARSAVLAILEPKP